MIWYLKTMNTGKENPEKEGRDTEDRATVMKKRTNQEAAKESEMNQGEQRVAVMIIKGKENQMRGKGEEKEGKVMTAEMRIEGKTEEEKSVREEVLAMITETEKEEKKGRNRGERKLVMMEIEGKKEKKEREEGVLIAVMMRRSKGKRNYKQMIPQEIVR